MKLKFDITGMTCAACSARVEKVTAHISGVSKVDVNLLAGKMTVEADNVLIETVKPCEDAENAYILRLYEAEGGSAATRLQFAAPPRAVYRTNMLEEVIEEIDPQNVPLTFSPFHIETLKVVY